MAESRLQLRWEPKEGTVPDEFGRRTWTCFYELAIALDENDIRREDQNGNKVRDHFVTLLGSTQVGSAREPCRTDDGSYNFDAPFRDGAHARWDAAKLGGLPVVSIAIDGTVIPQPIRQEHGKDPSLIAADMTYYAEGKDGPWFEGLSDKEFAEAISIAAMDLNDTGLGDDLDKWMPFQIMLVSAAARIERLANVKGLLSEAEDYVIDSIARAKEAAELYRPYPTRGKHAEADLAEVSLLHNRIRSALAENKGFDDGR